MYTCFFFSFNEILLEISKIPMLPSLLEYNSEEKNKMNNLSISMKSMINQSLLEWVTSRNSLENLEHIVEHCKNSLKQVCKMNYSNLIINFDLIDNYWFLV